MNKDEVSWVPEDMNRLEGIISIVDDGDPIVYFRVKVYLHRKEMDRDPA